VWTDTEQAAAPFHIRTMIRLFVSSSSRLAYRKRPSSSCPRARYYGSGTYNHPQRGRTWSDHPDTYHRMLRCLRVDAFDNFAVSGWSYLMSNHKSWPFPRFERSVKVTEGQGNPVETMDHTCELVACLTFRSVLLPDAHLVFHALTLYGITVCAPGAVAIVHAAILLYAGIG
jgi:hypothetical protein